MKLKVASTLLALAASCYGATITFSSFAGNYDGSGDVGVILSTGTPVAPSQGLARIGYFASLTNAQVTALATSMDYATLFAPGSFVSLVSDNFTGIATAYGATAGFVSAGASNIDAAGRNNTLYAYFTSGTELGLFRTTSLLVPDAGGTSLETTYALSFSAGQAVIGAPGPSYIVPSYGPDTNLTNVSVGSFQLINPIPEPSAALLGALGVLGLLRRRRI